MELLAPAGNLEKARIAFRYGADAVYLGIQGFSLRAAAESPPDAAGLRALKSAFPGRRVYGALNRFVHQKDMAALEETLRGLCDVPLDALILADVGIVEVVRSALPEIELHLSTQANCTNAAAARIYHRLGFSRIVPARELTLAEIREIHRAVPDLEIEVFVHGAMCMAYSGRCFLSHEMTGRSANQGDCAHSCRWHYSVVEEKRPGEYYPVEQDGRSLAIFSSRDLMLLDDLQAIKEAGVTAVKIEGRMKSALYTATATRAYRAALDGERNANRWKEELFSIPHRPYTRGFLREDMTVHEPAGAPAQQTYRLMGIVGPPETTAISPDRRHPIQVKNTIARDATVDMLLPDGTIKTLYGLDLRSDEGVPISRVVQGAPAYLVPPEELAGNDLTDGIIRQRDSRTVAPRR